MQIGQLGGTQVTPAAILVVAGLDGRAWEGYLLRGGIGLAAVGVVVWLLADLIARPRHAMLNPQIAERRAKLMVGGGGAIVAGVAVALLMLHPLFSGAVLALGVIWMVLWVPASRRLITSGATVIVDRVQTDVFDFITDLGNGPRYIPVVQDVVRLSGGSIRAGTRFHVRTSTFEWDEEVIEYSRPDYFSTQVVAPELARSATRLEPVDGETRVTFSYIHEMSWARALTGQGIEIGSLRVRLSELRRGWLQNLKTLLEAERN